ncbi:hypothetical protein EP331_09165 [bacterium]|nr:MAG: hypothetical protein EP331_09165 [bacterium]
MFKKIFYYFLSLIIVLALMIYWAANPSNGLVGHTILGSGSQLAKSGDTLRILTYNISYGYGIGSDGTGYKKKPKEAIIERLNNLAMVISDFKVDIALLQEVDFDADRSGNEEQAKYLSGKTGLSHITEAVTWNARYVPFPYLPVENQFGKTKSGGAIISKYPLEILHTEILHKPDANPWWYNLFYLNRFIQVVSVDLGEVQLPLANMHLEAFDITNREEQAQKLVELLAEYPQIQLFGGDMNSLPSNAHQVNNFDDSYGDDYKGDRTQEIISGIVGYTEPKGDGTESTWFTFPALKLNRQLDYFYVKSNVEVIGYEVLQVGDVSDHLPILLTIKLN